MFAFIISGSITSLKYMEITQLEQIRYTKCNALNHLTIRTMILYVAVLVSGSYKVKSQQKIKTVAFKTLFISCNTTIKRSLCSSFSQLLATKEWHNFSWVMVSLYFLASHSHNTSSPLYFSGHYFSYYFHPRITSPFYFFIGF